MTADVELAAFQERLAGLDRHIGQLAWSNCSLDDFFREFLERTVSVLGIGGAIWQIMPDGQTKRAFHINLAVAGLDEGGTQEQLLAVVLQKVGTSANTVVLPGRDSSDMFDGGLGKAVVNQAAQTLLFVPILAGNGVAAVILLISPEDVDPRSVRGYSGFVAALCGKASLFLQRQWINDMEGQLGRSDRLRQYVSSLHSGLDPQRTGYALANYAQELLGVYRCMAGTFDSRGRFRMRSVSGLESVAVKSSFIKSISEIAKEVCRNDKLLLVDNPDAVDSAERAGGDGDELLTAARLYMLQAESKVMGVFPIRCENRVVGALVVEKAKDQPIDTDQRRQIEGLLVEAGAAIANCLSYRHLPFSLLLRPVAAARDALYRMDWARRAVWLGLLAIVLLLPFVIRRPVKVVGAAELVPVEARIAYAGQDGQIVAVSVPADRMVKTGEVLASLDTRTKDSDLDRIENQIQMTTQELSSAIKDGRAADEAILESRLNVFNAEKAKCLLELEQYKIKAPLDGKVITRQSTIRQLFSRPVLRGEEILEVVPEQTDWELIVNVPEDQAGELLEAYDNLAADDVLKAKVILNVRPELKFDSYVISVAPRAIVHDAGDQKYRNVIEVRVLEPEGLRESIDPRKGMEGKVAIECGRRSLFYAVTHEFANFVRVSMF